MHDECLREQTDDEPTRLKERLSLYRAGVKYIPHHKKCHDIEDGTYGANEYHEAGNAACIPFARMFEKIRVNIVPRDRHLRNVVQQVLHQQLNWQHRQERQKDAGDQNTKHIAEIRACRHFYVFDDKRKLVYTGRGVDNPRDTGKMTINDLDNALTEITSGKKVTTPLTNPIGCNVKWDGKDAHWMPPDACDLV